MHVSEVRRDVRNDIGNNPIRMAVLMAIIKRSSTSP